MTPMLLATLLLAAAPQTAPRPLAEGAVVQDWPSFLGPDRNGISKERPLDPVFGPGGPPLVWSIERGEGLASPAIAKGRLVFTHRVDGVVHVDGLDPLTGERAWRHSFPCDYASRYFENGGPRSTPTIAGDRVVVHGVGGDLICLALADGEVHWQRNTSKEYGVGDDFFGVVSTPLVVGDVVVQNVGAADGRSVVAFDLETGKQRWAAGDEWGPSCASPALGTIAGEPRILVVAGGESRPPTGGLFVLSTAGELTWSYPFRSRTALSVNAASPVVLPDGAYLTASYGVGSAVVDIDAEGAGKERWRERLGLALEFSTPLFVDGSIVAVDGVSHRGGALVAVDPRTGKEEARTSLSFERTLELEGAEPRSISTSVGAGSLIRADGVFWVLGDTGELVTARRKGDGFEVISSAPLFRALETWTPPVISHGLLYICQNNRESGGGAPARLLCYDVRKGIQ